MCYMDLLTSITQLHAKLNSLWHRCDIYIKILIYLLAQMLQSHIIKFSQVEKLVEQDF